MSDSLSLTPTGQTITFNEIPADRRDPGVLVEIRPNYTDTGLLLLPSRAVIISQMTAGGLAMPGQVCAITGPGQAELLFGAGSVAATQVNYWLANNSTTPLFAIGLLDAPGATHASTTIGIGNVTFANGFSVTARIAGMRVPVAVPPGATQTELAAALIVAANAMSALPVTAMSAPGPAVGVVLTAKNAGLCGNSINVRFTDRSDATAPLTALLASVAPPALAANLTGGLGNPDATPAIATIAGTWYTDICTPWTDPNNRAVLAAEGVRRYGALVNLDARMWGGLGGSYATLAGYGDAGNSRQMVTVGVRNPYEPDWVWGAVWGAIHAFRLANDPSRQSKGVACVGLTAPDPADQFTSQERDLLLRNGISTWTALNDGTVVISRTVTGYLQSNLGVPDTAWLDIMTPSTMSAIRYDWRDYVELVYPAAKLFDDDSIGAEYDDTAVTPRRMRGTWAKRCLDYERAGWIEGSASTVRQGYFVRNPSDKNRLDQEMVVTTAGNLIIDANVLEFTA